ncbi:MAG TPA: AraC family transcriptional regulator, partial [Acetobacteraceae bacterium]
MIAISPLLRELILGACAEPLDWDPDGRGGHLAALALDEIAHARALPLALPVPRDPRLLRLTDRLRAQPDDRRDLDAWAADAGASVRTLTRLFRRETGMSFQQWRRQLRLTEAV